jgi:hypothetical protein
MINMNFNDLSKGVQKIIIKAIERYDCLNLNEIEGVLYQIKEKKRKKKLM